MPSLLRRTLDVDTTNRRLAFAHVLAEIPPRSLSLKQRQTVLGRGLRDREEAVRKAAKKLVAKWAELLAQSGQDAEGIIEAFVGLFDVYTTDGKAIAEKALEGLFELRPDLIESIDLSGACSAGPLVVSPLTCLGNRRRVVLPDFDARYSSPRPNLHRSPSGAGIESIGGCRACGNGSRFLLAGGLDAARRIPRR